MTPWRISGIPLSQPLRSDKFVHGAPLLPLPCMGSEKPNPAPLVVEGFVAVPVPVGRGSYCCCLWLKGGIGRVEGVL